MMLAGGKLPMTDLLAMKAERCEDSLCEQGGWGARKQGSALHAR